jgi:peptidoglycan/LPS O-acetylase OafA/YrhL
MWRSCRVDIGALRLHAKAPTRQRLAAVDALRGLACLAVVLFHYVAHIQRYSMEFNGIQWNFEYGRYGVQLFFVISGFFVFQTIEKCKAAKEFLFLRFSRIYPVYWAVLILIFVVDFLNIGSKVWLSGYFVNATMLQAYVGFPDIDLVFWTLAVELAFYILMALLMATKALNHPIAVSLLWLALANTLPFLKNYAPVQYDSIKIWIQILLYGPFFIAGMMFHYLRSATGQKFRVAMGVIFLCVATEIANNGLFMGGVAVVVFLIMGLAIAGKLQFLVSPVTLWLGSISYPLYLVHRNLGYRILFELYALEINAWAALISALGVAFILASGFTYWLEQPSLRWLRSRIKP